MTDIVRDTDEFVMQLFKDELPHSCIYHNYTHTKRVLKSVEELIEHSEVDERSALILRLTALLHDTGYTKGRDEHEEASAIIAREYLNNKEVEPGLIKEVERCILATKMVHEPTDPLEEIIRDADASHFGKDYFEEASEFLRQELLANGVEYSTPQWREENIRMFIEDHRYYTPYALKNWQPNKESNLADLIQAKNKQKKKRKKEELKAKLKARYKNESPERGIQTFYRTALRNHIKLSDIADTKANILLSVNAIIISLILANLFTRLDSNTYLIWPTVVFVLSSAVTMILAVIATRPNVTRGKFTKEDVANKRVNLTFFGNFHRMELSEYQWAINELLKDRDYVYASLTKDLYFLGKVLDRKYRILRVTYTIFVIGTILSILAFGIALYIYEIPISEVDDIINRPG